MSRLREVADAWFPRLRGPCGRRRENDDAARIAILHQVVDELLDDADGERLRVNVLHPDVADDLALLAGNQRRAEAPAERIDDTGVALEIEREAIGVLDLWEAR